MNTQQRTPGAVAPPFIRKPFASSILLWVRTNQPRQKGMDYWKGPHSKIISATPGFDEYPSDTLGREQSWAVAGDSRR